ncbi:hypothetical protein H0H93_008906 [Arthromyces matolae]|nr:hypothetical protein H0H93_008906 [Arthromyces matolae]
MWVAFTGYGDQSKRQRKLMHKAFGLPAIPTYYPLLQSETNGFLKRLIASPLNYVAHTRRYAGALTLKVVYGYEPLDYGDKFLTLAEECVDILANEIASGGGIWPVDIFPVLRYLPDWLPGAGFKMKARKWKAKMEEFVDLPAITRNERIYENPSSFIPERFLEKVDITTERLRDPRNYVFGFGRRKCPGQNLVESSIWLLMASMIATLNISKPVDAKSGKPVEPKVEFENPIFRFTADAGLVFSFQDTKSV